MASVAYSSAKRYRYLGQEDEAPEESPGEALRQKLLRELVEKQLSKHTSLEQRLNNKRKFVKAACEESVAGSTSGLASHEAFKSLELTLQVKQTLKSCGLTHTEIQLLLNGENKCSALEAPHARKQRLEAIEEKLRRHHDRLEASLDTPEQTINLTLTSQNERAEREQASGKAKQSCHSQDFLPEAHPMNHLKELAEELFPSEDPDYSHPQEGNRSKRHQEEPMGPAEHKKNKTEAQRFVYLTEKPESYWDMREIPKLLKTNANKLSGPLPLPPEKDTTGRKDKALHVTKTKTTAPVDQTKPFIMTLSTDDLIPLPDIEANRKTVRELRDMEKFKNYSEGTPSRTLYIKNLSPAVSPKDLAALMGHFESSDGPKILYRILGGRMRGQAFVTFPETSAATKALSVCNGYVLHGKPLVACYGKKT